MDRSTGDITDISVPRDDGSVVRALAELESKLVAYSTAMHEAHGCLARLEDRYHEARETSCPDQGPEHLGPADPSQTSPEDDVEPSEPSAPTLNQDAVQEPEAVVASMEQQERLTQQEADSPRCEGTAQQPRMEPVEPAAVGQADVEELQDAQPSAGTSENTGSSHTEEEALLASLDPETVKAIRVMRRLSCESKSVRELLQEYKASRQEANASKPEKKGSWLRRGR
jgi:hypothetical protein